MRQLLHRRRLRRSVVTAAIASAFAAGAAAACGDVAGIEARAETVHDTLVVFPLTGSAVSTPTALNTAAAQVTPVSPSLVFDVAFDLDAQRRVVLYPLKLVVQPLAGLLEVGFQKVAGTFDSVDRAPVGTYARDSALVVSVGEVVVIEAQRNRANDICSFALSPFIYSKLVVDSVTTGSNEIWFRFVTNPNCGFRSFAPGLPRD